MTKFIAVLAFGVLSSISFADPAPAPVPAPAPAPAPSSQPHHKELRFRCDLEGQVRFKKERLQCWVEGEFERKEALQSDEKRETELRIRCSHGFTLVDRDAAAAIEDRTLWINGQEDGRIATLRVREVRHSDEGEDRDRDRFRASLLISEDGAAERLEGACRFQKDRD